MILVDGEVITPVPVRAVRALSNAPALGHIDVRNFTRADELITLGEAAVIENWAAIAALL